MNMTLLVWNMKGEIKDVHLNLNAFRMSATPAGCSAQLLSWALWFAPDLHTRHRQPVPARDLRLLSPQTLCCFCLGADFFFMKFLRLLFSVRRVQLCMYLCQLLVPAYQCTSLAHFLAVLHHTGLGKSMRSVGTSFPAVFFIHHCHVWRFAVCATMNNFSLTYQCEIHLREADEEPTGWYP